MRVPSAAFVYLFGPGIWRWRVRAEFPKIRPASSRARGRRTCRSRGRSSEPSGARTSFSGNHVLLSWNWKLGAKDFRVQISQRARLLDDARGRDDRQHELCAAPDASVLRERRIALLARRRAGQELQRRRLHAARSGSTSPSDSGSPVNRPGSAQALDARRRDRLEPDATGRSRARPCEVVGRGHPARSGAARTGRARSPSASGRGRRAGSRTARRRRDTPPARCRCASASSAYNRGRGHAREGRLRAGRAGRSSIATRRSTSSAQLTAEAAGEGASLVVFPEAFIPVYPSSTWAKASRGLGRRARQGGVRACSPSESVTVPGRGGAAHRRERPASTASGS